MTASSKLNLNTDFTKIDENLGNNTVEAGDLSVLWKKLWPANTHSSQMLLFLFNSSATSSKSS